MSGAEQVFLVDNGSLAPASVRRLRAIAEELGARLGREIVAAPLLHGDRIPAGELGGKSVEVLETALRRPAAAGARDFAVLPLFVGPSGALTEYLPARAAEWRSEFPGLRLRIGAPLFADGDDRLARMLADAVRAAAAGFCARAEARVAVVDHGSPARAVTAVRDAVAAQLGELLGGEVAMVAPCSMERRPGAAYAFNEPLLENLLAQPGWRESAVIVGQLFLLPGRHAGPAGDVAEICARAEAGAPGLRTRRTALLGEHPQLIDVLADRYRALGGLNRGPGGRSVFRIMNGETNQGNWNDTRAKLKEKYKNLTDDDLEMANGKGQALVDRIQQRTGADRGDIERYLREECGCV